MKKQIWLTLGLIILLTGVSTVPSHGANYTSFSPVATGNVISWKVLDCNETNNIVEPVEWYNMSDWSFVGEYVINIGDIVKFTVQNVAECTGKLEIGNLTVSSMIRADAGFNLNLFTGPVYLETYEFNPSFISSTDWDEQIELANNASDERGATMIIQPGFLVVMGFNRSVIAFNYTTVEGLESNGIYDNETGVLLYFDYKFELSWLKMVITIPTIPSFGSLLTIIVLIGLSFIIYSKGKFHIKFK